MLAFGIAFSGGIQGNVQRQHDQKGGEEMGTYAEIHEMLLIKPDGNNEYIQPLETVKDFSAYSEAFVDLLVTAIERDAANIVVKLQSAVINEEEYYVDLHSSDWVTFSADPTLPSHTSDYLNGTNASGTQGPGFAKYIRVKVEFSTANQSIVLAVRAIFK